LLGKRDIQRAFEDGGMEDRGRKVKEGRKMT
jgi:hypothetical protein